MKKPSISKRKYLVLAVVGIVALIFGLVACADEAPPPSDEPIAATPAEGVDLPNPADFEWNVITAEGWKEVYPDIYASYMSNLDNKPFYEGGDKHNYLEDYPMLLDLYAPHRFTQGYWQAAGHPWSIQCMESSPRIVETFKQNCYGCKTPQFISLILTDPSANNVPFFESEDFTEPVSCWSCHENDPTSVTVQSPFWVAALGSDAGKVPASAAACGQCHNEYHFNKETGEIHNPYTDGLVSMTVPSLLEYYDNPDLHGGDVFFDFRSPRTDAPMLKMQHPEFEMIYGGRAPSTMAGMDYGCADCHMGPTTAADGSAFTSHYWQSPLKNDDLVANTCETDNCHSDLKAQVAEWQAGVVPRFTTIGNDLLDMVNLFGDKVEAGAIEGDDLAKMQMIQRHAQTYWDFVLVENSNGAHNRAYAHAYLDEAEKLIKEGMALLG
ncbi:MAG: ammonia-forming cytochrome c nitrite reductase subunit c552 [Coriobacteriia bacterium]|nr:ammonia-forming cytochrome c nitrite reductase subunit c552 [Coriobacteriia bacterium]